MRRLSSWIIALWVSVSTGGAMPMHLISAPALSADGNSMVFEWCDDLWIAPSQGGEAKRVVDDAGRDAYPRFTPDGKRIVFSSDRSGSMEVYSKAIAGGECVRHSWQSEGNELECLSPDGKQAIVRGLREHAGFLKTRLMEIDLTKDLRERRLFDVTATSAAWSPDGDRILFCTGGEQLYRKGYHGSRCSEIWLYQKTGSTFTGMSAGAAEERSPLWLPDGKGFYFVSNRDGTANLWLKREGLEATQVTRFKDDGVVTPDLSADGGTFVFRVGTAVHRFRPSSDKEPVPIELRTTETLPEVSMDRRRITGVTSADFTPDLQQVVFSAAGELWRIRKAGGTAERLTTSAASEEEIVYSPDSDFFHYLKDDGIEANYHRARLGDQGLLEDRPVTSGKGSKSRFKVSPDGTRIAWVQGTGSVFIANADGTSPREVFPCWDKPAFDWSPDGKWLAIAAEDADSNRDIWLVPLDGDKKPFNVTNHPAFDGSPKWSPDGRWLVFSSRRDESGKCLLWKIDLVSQDFANQSGVLKATLIPTKGIEPTRVVWRKDSQSLWFQSANSSNEKLYQILLDGTGMQTAAMSRGIPIRMAKDGSLLWRVKRAPERVGSFGTHRFPIDLSVERPRVEVLTLGFRRIWRTLGERYYDPEMNGRDWERMRLKYEEFARNSRTSAQFDRVISLLRGELNASHLAFHRAPWPEENERTERKTPTAHPGIVFSDGDHPTTSPLIVKRVISGSPVAALANAPRPGETVLRIAGETVFHRSPMHKFFDGAEGRVLPLTLRGSNGKERTVEVRCVSYQKIRTLDAAESLELTKNAVRTTHPEFAYLTVPDMNLETLNQVELDVFRARQHTGLILDLRDNTGGREADRLLHLFCQPNHAYTIPRDGPRGYPLERRIAPAWDKPFVVLCNQDTFSNGEIFCHAVKQLKLAPLVGAATAGGVISAIKTPIPDVGVLQVPFRGWFANSTGENMDEHGAQPDVPVKMTPTDQDQGRDPQLLKAMETLGESIRIAR